MARLVDLPKVLDNKVDPTNVSINQRELKGILLDGRSKVNMITEDTAKPFGLKWEPIAFNERMANNTIV